jgi:hypothetical protein
MSFDDIERVLGAMLPKRAARPQWWTIETKSGARPIQQCAWHDAGYDAALVEGRDRVCFRRRG